MLRDLGARITDAFYSVEGAEAIRSDWENTVLKVIVDVDQERARRAGVSSEDIARTLYSHFEGQQITDYREGEEVIPVLLRSLEGERNNLDRIRTIEVFTESGKRAIPLIIIGANTGLLIFGAYFDFTAMLGLFSLAGIIINNGIVMIDRIDQARDEGLDVDAAIELAAMTRARPIIMTTITTVAGLLPLALFGGEFWYGMAIVIMSGLTVGTILTLGFVPVLYSLFFRRVASLNPVIDLWSR